MNCEGTFVVVFVIAAIIIAGFIIGDLIFSYFKGGCNHKWSNWGDPIDDKQHRQCSKCWLIERKYL
jgi:hypothetical protein